MIIKTNDWIIILMNLVFFMIVQTYFFRYIASKQYENVLSNKLGLFQTILNKNPQYKQLIKTYKNKYLEKNQTLVQQQYLQRQLVNQKLEQKYCWTFIHYTNIFILLLFLFTRQKWTSIHTLGVIFVILGYVVELLFFFFIVQPYQFIGDHFLLSQIYKKMTQKLNT